MEGKKNIYESINAVMADVGAVGKEKRNQQQGFMYRGIDDVMNALNPALIKHRVFIVPEVLEQRREERQTNKGGNLIYSVCKMKYTFYAEDGSSIESVVIGEGMDSGDKASNKAMAAAYKYACFQVFCIPTEEMRDPDAESHETRGKGASKPAQPPNEQNPSKPQLISEEQFSALMRECNRTGIHWREICKIYQINQFSEMTVQQYQDCMKRFKVTSDKPKESTSTPPDDFKEDGLPWNTPAR